MCRLIRSLCTVISSISKFLQIIDSSQFYEQRFLLSGCSISEVRKVFRRSLGDESSTQEEFHRSESRKHEVFIRCRVLINARNSFPVCPAVIRCICVIIAGAAFSLAVNLDKALNHTLAFAVTVYNLTEAVTKTEMVLQFALAGKKLRIWVAVLYKSRLSLAVLSCKCDKAGIVRIKINADFVLSDSFFDSCRPTEFEADKFPCAMCLCTVF